MSDESEPLKHAIKGTTPSGDIVWLTAPDSNGCRYLGPLDTAEQFEHKSDAQLVIAELPRPFRDAGLFFWVTLLATEAEKKRLHEIAARVLGEARATEFVQMIFDPKL